MSTTKPATSTEGGGGAIVFPIHPSRGMEPKVSFDQSQSEGKEGNIGEGVGGEGEVGSWCC